VNLLCWTRLPRLSREVGCKENSAYPDDGRLSGLDIMIGEGPAARSIKLDLPPFTLCGATDAARAM